MKITKEMLKPKKEYKLEPSLAIDREPIAVPIPDLSKLWIQVYKFDIPNKEVHANILTGEGREASVFGIIADDVLNELLNYYKNGADVFLVRTFRGAILQIIETPKEGE